MKKKIRIVIIVLLCLLLLVFIGLFVVYNDKAVLFMAILTIMAALFGLVLYRYTGLRYIIICIGMIAGIKIALVALKKMKNNL